MTDCIGFSVNTNLCFGQPSFSGLWFRGLAVNSFFPWGSQPSTRLYRLKATCIIHDVCAHCSSKTSYAEGLENQNPSTINCPFLIPCPPTFNIAVCWQVGFGHFIVNKAIKPVCVIRGLWAANYHEEATGVSEKLSSDVTQCHPLGSF